MNVTYSFNTAGVGEEHVSKSFEELTMLPNYNDIKYINCRNKKMTFLPILPTSLKQITCSSNNLSDLPHILPTNLTHLDCSHNKISSFGTLPTGLIVLNCSHNQLTLLPNLPNSLTDLRCSYNQLTQLPPLPKSLTYLTCFNNHVSFNYNIEKYNITL